MFAVALVVGITCYVKIVGLSGIYRIRTDATTRIYGYMDIGYVRSPISRTKSSSRIIASSLGRLKYVWSKLFFFKPP